MEKAIFGHRVQCSGVVRFPGVRDQMVAGPMVDVAPLQIAITFGHWKLDRNVDEELRFWSIPVGERDLEPRTIGCRDIALPSNVRFVVHNGYLKCVRACLSRIRGRWNGCSRRGGCNFESYESQWTFAPMVWSPESNCYQVIF